MVQMVGVLILALGLPQMFESLHEGEHVDNGVMVLGYVVMRVPMLFQWWRASRQDPERAHALPDLHGSRSWSARSAGSLLALADPSIGDLRAGSWC